MNNLELEKLGIQELDGSEMMEMNGGSFWTDVVKTLAIDLIIDGLTELGKAVADGYHKQPGTPMTMTSLYSSNPYH